MHTREVVRTALEQKSLSGIVEVLDVIREDFRAAGCVIWEQNPNSLLAKSDSKGSLFVLAQCFKPRRVQASWNLDLTTSLGRALLSNEIYECRDVQGGDALNLRTYPFKLDPTLTQFCAIPLTFVDNSDAAPERRSRGALALYFCGDEEFFSREQIQQIRRTADLFPSLHQVIRDRVSLSLIDEVTRTVHAAEADSSRLLTAEQINDIMQDICHKVGTTFGCMETSIYLEDSAGPGLFRLAATTLDREYLKPFYKAEPREGLTGWVLYRRSPKWIFDLDDLSNIVAADPDLTDLVWSDPMNIRQLARKQLGLTLPEEITPPLSWMAAPIAAGNRVHGAIRCCVSRQGPFYFADRELKLLTIVAAHLGQFWSNWLTKGKMNQENQLWRKLVSQVSDANRQVLQLVEQPVPAVTPGVERQAKTVLSSLEAEIEDGVRLAAMEAQQTTMFRAKRASGWTDLNRGRESDLDGPAETMRQVLQQQFELYRGLAETVQDRFKAQETQTKTYLNLAHQLRSPVLAAHRRAGLALERNIQDCEITNGLRKIRGLCAKALTVTMSVKVYADLASSQTITLRLRRMLAGDLRQLAIECADDVQTSLDADRDLRFDVDKKTDLDRKGFDSLSGNSVPADYDLTRQSLTNILDNAGKYAKNGTTVRLSAGLTRSGQFHITVYNKPFFRPRDPDKWKLAGWRGEEAQDVTAEGSGLGLYIVDQVMTAHKGRLEIIPLNTDGLTEVKLIFPVFGS